MSDVIYLHRETNETSASNHTYSKNYVQIYMINDYTEMIYNQSYLIRDILNFINLHSDPYTANNLIKTYYTMNISRFDLETTKILIDSLNSTDASNHEHSKKVVSNFILELWIKHSTGI